MDQIDRMASSSSGNSDRPAKASNRPHGPAMASQDLPPPPTLKCPRCDSSNTKFCYYNNYSQTQPRHFCKSCRRYWTQGGTLRNVPIGGGCRKNKRVRPRPLISMGGLVDGPAPSFSDATSNMLGMLSSIPNFGSGANSQLVGSDTSSQLLNIAFARFQESMRLRQQSAHTSKGAPLSDMSLPALVHKPCGLSSCTGGACTNPSSLHMDGTCGGRLVGDSFENGLGFPTLQHAEAGYCNNSFDMTNPLAYAAAHTSKMHNMMGTSATATLASIEDELSNFSNLQYQVDPFNGDGTPAPQQEQKAGFDDLSTTRSSAPRRLISMPVAPLPLLEHGPGTQNFSYAENSLQDGNNTDLVSKHAAEDQEEKAIISSINGDHGLSLMMSVENWHPQSSTMEMLYEPHQGMMWSTNTARWHDMHPLASSTAAAGSVL